MGVCAPEGFRTNSPLKHFPPPVTHTSASPTAPSRRLSPGQRLPPRQCICLFDEKLLLRRRGPDTLKCFLFFLSLEVQFLRSCSLHFQNKRKTKKGIPPPPNTIATSPSLSVVLEFPEHSWDHYRPNPVASDHLTRP